MGASFNNNGFSLFEMLVTISLFGLFMGLFYPGLQFFLNARERTERNLDEIFALVEFSQTLETSIESLALNNVTITNTGGFPLFSGDDLSLTFKATSNNNPLNWVSLYFDSATETVHLKFCSDINTYQRKECTKDITLHDVKQLEIQYLSTNSYFESWQQIWRSNENLPEAIKISILFSEVKGWDWPILLIHPKIQEQSFCNYDFVTRKCP